MSCLEYFPKECYTLPFYCYISKSIPISALNKEAKERLWQKCLVHYGPHSIQQACEFVNSVPNLSKFDFDDVVIKYPTCLKTTLTKSWVGIKVFVIQLCVLIKISLLILPSQIESEERNTAKWLNQVELI